MAENNASKLRPILDKNTISQTMGEKTPPYSDSQAVTEANRCLYCYDAPCIMACPTGIDIPTFIKKIASGNVTGSAKTILTANILGASCARVCPTEVLCEGACVVGDNYEPVQIGRLQRYATDHVMDNNISVLSPPAEKTDKRIAIIGAGPAGLGCAAELAQRGHRVTILEKKTYAGGLNTDGIAYYKMKPEISLAEVELVKSLGVEVRTGIEVGSDITAEQLQSEYDAIFIGVGLGQGVTLGLPGENAPEVMEAIDFIAKIRTQPLDTIPVGKRVAVIGCGNTAIDAVDQSKRLGAEIAEIIYRRGEEDMSAYDFEYELAKKDGCTFRFHTLPTAILTDDAGHVTGLRLVQTEKQPDGRVTVVTGSEWEEAYDSVIYAIGQEKQGSFLQTIFPDLAVDAKGRVIADSLTGATNLPKVFAGGDCVNGGREVVNAVGEGKKAAHAIHRALTEESVSPDLQPSRYGIEGGARGSGILQPIRVTELETA